MSEEVNQMNLYQRMSAITNECETVAKNLSVSAGKSGSYKAVGEGDVLRAIKPLEVKYGVYSYPFKREVIQSEYYTSENGRSNQFMRIDTTYRFVNMDNPNEYIDITTYGDGVDSQDKAPGKAMTYADKYALLKGYKIETGEDPDKDASGDLGNKQSGYKKSTQKQDEKPFTFSAADIFVLCNQLGKSVESVQSYCAEKYGCDVKGLSSVELSELGSMLWNKAYK